MIKVLEHLLCEKKLKELGLFSPGVEKAQGDLIQLYKYLKKGVK